MSEEIETVETEKSEVVRSGKVLAWLIIANIIGIGTSVVGAFVFLLAFGFADLPEALGYILTLAIAGGIIFMAVKAWKSYLSGDGTAAIAWSVAVWFPYFTAPYLLIFGALFFIGRAIYKKNTHYRALKEKKTRKTHSVDIPDKTSDSKIIKRNDGSALAFVLLLLVALVILGIAGSLFLDNRRHIVKERPTAFPATAMPTVMSPGSPSIGSTWFQAIDGMTLVYVPEGEFQMGSENSFIDYNNEKPVHAVFLDAYWIDQTEVTNLMYAKCVTDGACNPPEIFDALSIHDGYYVSEEFDNYPVVKVSWHDSVSYCTWAGRRLPTEAEWEKAARGGLEGKRYPWGDTAPICEDGAENGARFTDREGDAGCDGEYTIKVASYSPNGYGLYDMAGNVSEWVADIHSKLYSDDYYANSPYSNPLGVDLGDGRMQRGGGNTVLQSDPDDLGVAYRYSGEPDDESTSVGFRCALSP